MKKMRRAICLSLSPGRYKNSKYLQASTGITPPSTTVDGGNVTTAKNSLMACQGCCPRPNPVESRVGGDRADHRGADSHYHPGDGRLRQGAGTGVQSSLGTVTTYGNKTGIAFSLKIETMTKAEMESQMAANTYDIALYPMEAASQSPVTFLSNLLSTNYMKLQSDKIERALTVAKNATAGTATAACRACEQALIQTGAVLPVFYESAYYVMAGGVSGVQFHPGSGRVSFVEAVRSIISGTLWSLGAQRGVYGCNLLPVLPHSGPIQPRGGAVLAWLTRLLGDGRLTDFWCANPHTFWNTPGCACC